MNSSSIQTTVVGSYPIPDWLALHPTSRSLQDAIATVLKTQELAGIDVVADGELYRFDVNHPETNGMIEYFVLPLENVRGEITRADIQAFQEKRGMGFRAKPAGVVEGEMGPGTLNLVRDFTRVRELTNRSVKFTVTGPHMLSKTLLDYHYNELPELAMGIASILADQIREIDADIVQIDEANLPGAPDEAEWAAEAINLMLDAVPTTPAVHLCFGNYGGQSIQQGTWEALIEYMNALHVDHMVLEFARRGYGELEHFKELRQEIRLGLGVIDIKDTEIESPETVAKRIETAVDIIGEGRIRFVNPDCGFWMLKRSIADGKIRSLVKGRDLFLGKNE